MRTDITVATIAAALAVATPLSAQQGARGKLVGTIAGSIASRSVQAAGVSLVQMDQERSVTFNAMPDVRGRFQIDSLPAGRYLVQVSDPTLDSLDLALPSSELSVAAGRSVRADFALPTGAQLRAAVCPGVTLADGKAAVAGRVIDADTDQPLAGAQVVAGWTEFSVDKQSVKAQAEKRIATVTTAANGDYRLCGVPSAKSLWIQVQHRGRAGSVTRLSVTDEEGAVVRNISMSEISAPTIAELDSAQQLAIATGDSTVGWLALSGTAILSGSVRRETGEPVAGAQVRVHNARSFASTDAGGRFTIRELPAGTQVMVVRSIGFGVTEIPVELRPGKTVTQDVRVTRATMLDSVRVVATKPNFAEFEYNMRNNHFGKFMAAGEIVRRDAKETGDLIRALGGFNVVGRGPNTKTFSRAALAANPKCGEANIVLEGVEGLSINDVYPSNIGGIEAYPDNAFIPARYLGHGDCGLIVIWLKAQKDKRPGLKTGTSYNGY
jgi:hypothetical protein